MRPPSYSSVVSLAALLGVGAFAVVLFTGAPSEREARGLNRRGNAVPRAPATPRWPADADELERWLAEQPEGLPAPPRAWLEYGRKRHAQGRIEDALTAWREAERRYEAGAANGFEGNWNVPWAWRNYAHVRALLGDAEGAIEALTKAAEKGFGEVEDVAEHPDFAPIREDPRFQAAVRRMRENPRLFNAG